MRDFFEHVIAVVGVERFLGIGRGLILLAVGWLAASLAGRAVSRLAGLRFKTHNVFLVRRSIFFVIFVVFLAAALHEIGFKLGLLFGAAGILTIAIGFAAKTAASNVISGLFLIAEEPFEIGESIQVGSTSGTVDSIDLLSVKLETFDGVYVRIPNEDLLSAEIRNYSRLPLRRVEIFLGVSHGVGLDELKRVLLEVAREQPFALDDPQPAVLGLGLGEACVDLRFSVWTKREHYEELRTALSFEVPRALTAAGIEIPVPKREVRIEDSQRS